MDARHRPVSCQLGDHVNDSAAAAAAAAAAATAAAEN